ncbi:hypothetical protein CUJ83_03650 [Methanocella sp. CWC-04]|uniref:Uncharacterized protein n=1 Tax=Methanooceanicella nereidis TaxID=2052831 RepID=A0AAP2W595_9EURY|nr:hypothetical protein [Methanocella sp. CWC-04]MCD1294088.1 hypothetical protein [Methanocella sp. CWC-04]
MDGDNLFDNYVKHAFFLREWGIDGSGNSLLTREEYVSKAAELLNCKDLNNGVRIYSYIQNGTTVVYDPEANEWAEGTEDGQLKNFFKPDNTKKNFVRERVECEDLICSSPKDSIDDEPDAVKKMLDEYEQAIDELDRNFDNIGQANCRACTPLVRKRIFSFWFDYIFKKGVQLPELLERFESINKKMEEFEQKRGGDYRALLCSDLEHYASCYSGIVEYFFKPEPVCAEVENDLNIRDVLEILMMELSYDYDLSLMEESLAGFDTTLKEVFTCNKEDILKLCPCIEEEYLPGRFWWRHPSSL